MQRRNKRLAGQPSTAKGSRQRLPLLFCSSGKVRIAMKVSPQWAIAALALALAVPAWPSARAQQPAAAQGAAAAAMSASDQDVLQSHRLQLEESAKIYGYDLAAGDWVYDQAGCAPMPRIILLRYRRRFDDGTESLFTALVPRGSGRVRIVPVLHRNQTPFVPAPRDPRNYALFNQLVLDAFSSAAAPSDATWLNLGACYAEMTGGLVNRPFGSNQATGYPGAPPATIRVDAQNRTAHVLFSTQEATGSYRVWDIAFNRHGKITAAQTNPVPTENRPGLVGEVVPQGQSLPPAETPRQQQGNQIAPRTEPQQAVAAGSHQQPSSGSPAQPSSRPHRQPSFASSAAPVTSSAKSEAPGASAQRPALPAAANAEPSASPAPANASTAGMTASPDLSNSPSSNQPPSNQPGWRYELHPDPPPSMVLPSAPPPREKIVRPKASSWDESTQPPR
jgi:hypothetical protein